ncbi:MAG: pyridoxamine 5'-phosphate oxidase family protein [Actinomycetota bacterium]
MSDVGDGSTAAGSYTASQRTLQEQQGSVPLADTLDATIIVTELDEAASTFIGSRDFFFLSTVTADGEPTVSHKGGGTGFVRVVDAQTLEFPSYDGNGMYLSMGNIADTGKIGMLFIDFVTPHRIRIQATASLSDTADDLARFPGADYVVCAQIDRAFINCGRYIHKHTRASESPYVPDEAGDAPVPAWKRIDLMQPVLDAETQAEVEATGGTIDVEEYARRLEAGEP